MLVALKAQPTLENSVNSIPPKSRGMQGKVCGNAAVSGVFCAHNHAVANTFGLLWRCMRQARAAADGGLFKRTVRLRHRAVGASRQVHLLECRMTKLHQDLHADGKRRRKLLRGTFAAPAVLTIYSGSAAATSVGSCLVKANSAPTTSGIGVTSADDMLFRYQLWGLVDNANPAIISSYWIRGTDLSVFIRNSQMPFLSSSQYQQFNVLSNLLVGTATTTVPSQLGFTFQPVLNWVVLRINGTGALVSAGSAGGGAPVGDSCWNSFFVASPP